MSHRSLYAPVTAADSENPGLPHPEWLNCSTTPRVSTHSVKPANRPHRNRSKQFLRCRLPRSLSSLHGDANVPGPHWTDIDKTALRQQLTIRELDITDVRFPGRSQIAVRTQAVRMGLIRPRQARLKWSNKQRKLLRKLKRDGYAVPQIFQFRLLSDPPRSFWSIRMQWGRMKLSDRKRSRRMKKKKVWKSGERAKFERFLVRHSQRMTPEEIGKKWGLARSTVARWQTSLGVKQPREKVMRMHYSLEKQRRASRRIRRNNKRIWAERRARSESELIALAIELYGHSRQPSDRECFDCGRTWPKRREFFHFSEKRTGFGTARYYKHRCRLCENARRRHLRRKKRTAKR